MIKLYMLICRILEGVHGQRKVGNPCSKVLHVLIELVDGNTVSLLIFVL